MCNHYLVDPTACTPASGWEKGQVENQVGNVREWLFTPKLKCADLSELNARLAARCLQLARERHHPEQTARKIIEVWEEERAALRAMPAPFDGYAEDTGRISQTCLVNLERNRRSVDCRFASRVATVRAYAERVVLMCGEQMIGDHRLDQEAAVRCHKQRTRRNPLARGLRRSNEPHAPGVRVAHGPWRHAARLSNHSNRLQNRLCILRRRAIISSPDLGGRPDQPSVEGSLDSPVKRRAHRGTRC
jgi:hypothetical protein